MNTGPIFTPEERVKRCVARHPDWPDWKVAKSSEVHVDTARSIRAGMAPTLQNGESKALEGNNSAAFVSLDKVIARYDIKAAILREIDGLPRGKLIVETELCQRTAGTDRNRFRRTCENNADELKPLRIKLRLDDSTEGKWFWGKREDIAEAQKMVNL